MSVSRILGSCIVLAALLLAIGNEHSLPNAASREAATQPVYAGLPLFFEANQGQSDPRVRFLSRGDGYGLFLTESETVLVTGRNHRGRKERSTDVGSDSQSVAQSVLRMKLVGANPHPELAGVGELPGKVNYLVGNDPGSWHTQVPIYSQVESRQVYPGIDLLFHGNQRQLEYDFVVAPGGDPSAIKLGISGARAVAVDSDKDVVLHTADGEILMRKPEIYQEIAGVRSSVEGGFILRSEDEVGFQLGAYDRSQALVIDPAFTYATFLGGSNQDQPANLVLDTISTPGKPKIYVGGSTGSMTTFPEPHHLIGSIGAGSYAFVAKIDATVTGAASLNYLTFLGGHIPFSGGGDCTDNLAGHIDLDTSKGASFVEPVITGETNCKDFPVTTSTPANGFLTRLMPSGAALDTSIFFGGNGRWRGGWISVDSSGNVVLAAGTNSTNLPATANAYATKLNKGEPGAEDCFVAVLNRSFVVQYLTYLNVGAGVLSPPGHVACGAFHDANHNIIAGGNTFSSTAFNKVGGGTLANGFQPTFAGTEDTFLMKLNPFLSGNAQVTYATYFGGGGTTEAQTGAIAIGNGLVTVVGDTTSGTSTTPPNIPLTEDAFQSVNIALSTSPKGIGYITLINPSLTGKAGLVFSSYFGGSGGDERVQSVAFDPISGATSALRVVLGGQTTSTNFPLKNPLQTDFAAQTSPAQDAFVAVMLVPMVSTGPKALLLFSTYIGGGYKIPGSHQNETILGVATDANHTIYATGRTLSDNFYAHTSPPTVMNGFQTKCNSCAPTHASPSDDVVVFRLPNPAQTEASSISLTSSLNPSTVGTAVTFTATVKAAVLGTPTGKVTFKDGTTTLGVVSLSARVAKFTTSSLAKGAHSITASYSGDATFKPSISSTLTQNVN